MGPLILAISILLYFNKKTSYSILLFLFMAFGGFGFISNHLMVMKGGDLAFIYMVIVNFYNYCVIPKYFNYGPISKIILGYLLFLIISSLYSYIVLDFGIITIFQGSRDLYLLCSYFFLIRMTHNQLKQIVRNVFYITLVGSILYIAQIPIGKPLLTYYTDVVKIDSTTGFPRFYNYPIFLNFILFICIFTRFVSRRMFILSVPILIVARLATLGRSGILMTFICVIYGLIRFGNLKRNAVIILGIGVLVLPFIPFVIARFQDTGTLSDFTRLLQGNYHFFDMTKDSEATFTYRIAWCYERLEYLLEKGVGGILFGVGLIGDTDPIVNRLFRFVLGLPSEETGLTAQIKTPDISYGNLIVRLGFLGAYMWLYLYWKIGAILRKNLNLYLFPAFYLLWISNLLGSFTGPGLSDSNVFIMLFIALSIVYGKDKCNNHLLQRS